MIFHFSRAALEWIARNVEGNRMAFSMSLAMRSTKVSSKTGDTVKLLVLPAKLDIPWESTP
jgi:hypothetical protein